LGMSEQQMCVEEVAADGTVGATLVAWKHYGTHSGSGFKPSAYTPATIAVETMATRFKVSVRHTPVTPTPASPFFRRPVKTNVTSTKNVSCTCTKYFLFPNYAPHPFLNIESSKHVRPSTITMAHSAPDGARAARCS
jgi:hypothetical protein